MSREVSRQSVTRAVESLALKRLGQRAVRLKSGFYGNEEGTCSVEVDKSADLKYLTFDIVGILPAVTHYDYKGVHSVVQVDYKGEEPDIMMHWELPSGNNESRRRVYPVSQVSRTKYGGLLLVRRAIVAAETAQGFFPVNLRA